MITSGPYTLDTEALARLAMDIADLRRHNYEILIVTSAAIAAGMGRMGIHRRPRAIPQLQALASIGQNLLLNAYEKALGMFGLPIGQVLLTIDDIHNRKRYTNLRNAFNELLRMGVIPIVNENDAVGTEEVKVGDKVKRGQIIGYSGATGWTASLRSHLHFHVGVYGKTIEDFRTLRIIWSKISK
jgi:glutamate 5-kinase